MILVPSERGAVRAVNLNLVGGDVVALSFVCRSPAHAAGLYDQVADRMASGAYDFGDIGAVAPKDPFVAGAPVRATAYDFDAGETSIEAVVVRRISTTHVKVRTRMGRTVDVHERDLRPRGGA